MKKKINIKTLAAELNLSVATISKAFKDSHEISKATKERVLAMASTLNYTPNPYASSLRKRKSNTIAVILPEVADNFFSLAINGIQAVAEKKGYHVLIYLSHEKFDIEKTIVDDCNSGRVDGVLISITKETKTAEHIQKLQDENIPVVFFDREFEGFKTARVVTNDYECGYLAAKHLIEKGCKKPAFFSISSSLPICIKRADGFKAGLIESGLYSHKKDPIVYFTDFNQEETFNQIKKLVTGKDRPDGVVASVEKLAVILYLVCHEKNIKIPEEIKVIAFSTVDTAPIFNPSLSTITQSAFEIGKAASEILFKGIEKKNYDITNEYVVIPSTFFERKSSQQTSASKEKKIK
ncbi:MAG: LacI family DNA-binding transcriptional regulator [Bacteroidota bacterium]|nr:LacI family DNA-binding transcriptional regulator [Bacteroidota bacterium]